LECVGSVVVSVNLAKASSAEGENPSWNSRTKTVSSVKASLRRGMIGATIKMTNGREHDTFGRDSGMGTIFWVEWVARREGGT
jgi:hypothetical protein